MSELAHAEVSIHCGLTSNGTILSVNASVAPNARFCKSIRICPNPKIQLNLSFVYILTSIDYKVQKVAQVPSDCGPWPPDEPHYNTTNQPGGWQRKSYPILVNDSSRAPLERFKGSIKMGACHEIPTFNGSLCYEVPNRIEHCGLCMCGEIDLDNFV